MKETWYKAAIPYGVKYIGFFQKINHGKSHSSTGDLLVDKLVSNNKRGFSEELQEAISKAQKGKTNRFSEIPATLTRVKLFG